MELRLPSETFFDLMVAFSFYKSCPGCHIGFDGVRQEARIVTEVDSLEATYKHLCKMKEQVLNGQLFGLQWISSQKKSDSKSYSYDIKAELPADARCYAHEYKITEKKDKDTGEIEKRYENSPIVFETRNDKNYSKCRKILKFITPNNVMFALTGKMDQGEIDKLYKIKNNPFVDDKEFDRALSGVTLGLPQQVKNYKNVSLEDEEFDRDKIVQMMKDGMVKEILKSGTKNPRHALSMGWIPHFVSNNVNITSEPPPPWLPIKSLLAMSALTLFSTYICRKRIVVDGYKYRGKRFQLLFVPLCQNLIDLQQFRLMHRHPHLEDYRKNRSFWHGVGLIAVRQFQLHLNKYDKYLERV